MSRAAAGPLVAVVSAALVCFLSSVATQAAAAPSGQIVVRIAADGCHFPGTPLIVGQTAFEFRNRTRRVQTVIVGGKRSTIRPRKTAVVPVVIAASGPVRYMCAKRPGTLFAQSEHVIGIRTTNGDGEFFVRASGERFIPRGATFLRRGPNDLGAGGFHVYTTTFEVGIYDAASAATQLGAMHDDGYNVVKVYIDLQCLQGCLGDNGTHRLSRAYLANVIDFLHSAKANGLLVDVIADQLPQTTIWARGECCGSSSYNSWYLPEPSVDGYREFWKAFISGLVEMNAPLEVVWAWQLQGEQWFEPHALPLSSNAGTVRTANGKSYNMASPAEKTAMLNDGIVYWIDQVRAAIKSVDPTALVTLGFFAPQTPNDWRIGDDRYVVPMSVIQQSTVDFIGLHPYPSGLPLAQSMQNFQVALPSAQPIVMGEFGAFKFEHSSAEGAARALVDWQRESCKYGFDGWLFWTWDQNAGAEGEPSMWRGIDDGSVIAHLLSPRVRPDPCT